ncbi:hypothetical protein ARAF_2631 [Arsenophonus endosymbiont of Aleurodicus floccissimus]|uniref:hypothetical protein n=1 Tax=Arsenophonus endosymbiont of Aleurodicus floccissimus TaxID=2152761 RepID=UPI000ED97ED8|nr:hypothetical protein [Arsenophonus endosymbiont of Aleurodicus floccissimus]SPP32466.1 hypothetical protein ARAF_2631 [Arsenophonus endosymbiont of Aleurodicus floccissimus]
MSFLTIEVDNYDNGNAYEPTKTIGINFESIGEISKTVSLGIPQILILSERKSFKTIRERDDYFDYIASKLEAIDLSAK